MGGRGHHYAYLTHSLVVQALARCMKFEEGPEEPWRFLLIRRALVLGPDNQHLSHGLTVPIARLLLDPDGFPAEAGYSCRLVRAPGPEGCSSVG